MELQKEKTAILTKGHREAASKAKLAQSRYPVAQALGISMAEMGKEHRFSAIRESGPRPSLSRSWWPGYAFPVSSSTT